MLLQLNLQKCYLEKDVDYSPSSHDVFRQKINCSGPCFCINFNKVILSNFKKHTQEESLALNEYYLYMMYNKLRIQSMAFFLINGVNNIAPVRKQPSKTFLPNVIWGKFSEK